MKRSSKFIDNRASFTKKLIKKIGYKAYCWKRREAKRVNNKYLQQ